MRAKRDGETDPVATDPGIDAGGYGRPTGRAATFVQFYPGG